MKTDSLWGNSTGSVTLRKMEQEKQMTRDALLKKRDNMLRQADREKTWGPKRNRTPRRRTHLAP